MELTAHMLYQYIKPERNQLWPRKIKFKIWNVFPIWCSVSKSYKLYQSVKLRTSCQNISKRYKMIFINDNHNTHTPETRVEWVKIIDQYYRISAIFANNEKGAILTSTERNQFDLIISLRLVAKWWHRVNIKKKSNFTSQLLNNSNASHVLC